MHDAFPADMEIIGIIMQGFFFITFIIPSMILLIKKWEHLDMYSRVMIILYQVNMTLKIVFYILEFFIGPIN
jgi:hypothetical protein